MQKRLLLFYLLILLLIIAIIGLGVAFYRHPISTQKEPLVLTISKGDSIEEIAKKLTAKGCASQIYAVLFMAKWLGKLDQIKAGEYAIPAYTTFRQLLKMLRSGQVLLHKITFPEGRTFAQILRIIAVEPQLTHTFKDHSAEEIMAIIGHPAEYPEGLFYPDTYLFSVGTTDTQILRLAYDLMQKKINQAWAHRALDLPYENVNEALIVASLIERESKIDAERPMVAGVILRRLKIGMRLQIDASVLYGLQDKTQTVLKQTDLRIDTPYNTYTRYGLPPTPIAMPGMPAINAALHPTSGSALYYVAKGDGSHIFSDTLAQHHVAVSAYRKARIVKHPVDWRQCISASLLLSRFQQSPLRAK